MKTEINLLPPEFIPKTPWVKSGRNMLIIVLIGIVLLLYLIFCGHMWLTSRKVNRVKDEIALYLPQAQKVQDTKAKIKGLQQKKNELQQILKEGRSWHVILTTINQNIPEGVWLTTLREDKSKGLLTLIGGSTSLEEVGDFINNLQTTGDWQTVTLKKVGHNGKNLTFSIEAVFENN
ncbi:MAG: type pilus assembly protein PilN [Clostridia bacterium]|nr:type pilus assembly protein PilN [Clostridia bacterium]